MALTPRLPIPGADRTTSDARGSAMLVADLPVEPAQNLVAQAIGFLVSERGR